MTEAETAGDFMERNGLVASDPASVISPFRQMIETRLVVLRSLRKPTVEQIEARLFWEEYLKANYGK